MDDNNSKNKDDSDIEIDPDYESTNSAIWRAELQEEEENNQSENKLGTIIQEEFDKELQIRQKQLEEIEEKIYKAQKLLHVVRYVLISSYYKNKSLEAEGSSSDPTNILQGQNRIHPAIKKLLGNNPNSLKLLTARTKRKATLTKPEPSKDIKCEAKRIKLEVKSEVKTATAVNTVKLEPNASSSSEPVTNRAKVQHRVVIGNISYFKKSLEQNNLTHKWMVYVKIYKGTNGKSEVTNQTISKVVFYLHPSYKPHDVVDISNPPFHLSRRGWGEFPLRVKIYFKSNKNKPVDVIHQLKLDNTFTERQTLGNETTVPIFLYEELNQTQCLKQSDENQPSTSTSNDTSNNFVKIGSLESIAVPASALINEQIVSIDKVKIEITDSYDHDYCNDNLDLVLKQEEIKEENICDVELEVSGLLDQSSLIDHSYSLGSEKEGLKPIKKSKSPVKQAYNHLVYGLGPHYLEPIKSKARSVRPKIIEKLSSNPDKSTKSLVKVMKTVTGQSIRFLPESFNQVLLTNGSVVSVKFLKSSSATGADQGNLYLVKPKSAAKPMERLERLKLPEHKFKTMGEALGYLFKRLPLWSPEAKQSRYKRTYPFCACSEKEFMSWNIGKKLSAEWSRAKTIHRIISGEAFSKNWTTKAIFMYGRSHSYSPPVASYKLFGKESQEKRLILDCYRNSSVQNGHSSINLDGSDEAINVISPEKPVIDRLDRNNLGDCIDISDKSLSQQCAYIKEAALDVGVIMKPEVLVNGISMNAAERLMLEAVKCFAENLVRRSRNRLICRQGYSNESSEISLVDVQQVLTERKEFETIRRFTINKKNVDFFS